MNNTSTSAENAEVTGKAKPAVKQTREEKILAGVMQSWGKLQASDKQWEQTGREFGKWCSELRKLYKQQGSRMGKGFEAVLKELKVDYQKARYWADEVDGKNKKKARNYAGAAPAKKTNDKSKGDDPKPTPFVLPGLTDEQHDAMARMETDAKGFAQFAHGVITSPGAEQVRFVVIRCLSKRDKLEDQLELLAELRGWIDRQCWDLQQQIEAGHTTVVPRRSLAFLDDNSTDIGAVRDSGTPNEPFPSGAGDLATMMAAAQQSRAEKAGAGA